MSEIVKRPVAGYAILRKNNRVIIEPFTADDNCVTRLMWSLVGVIPAKEGTYELCKEIQKKQSAIPAGCKLTPMFRGEPRKEVTVLEVIGYEHPGLESADKGELVLGFMLTDDNGNVHEYNIVTNSNSVTNGARCSAFALKDSQTGMYCCEVEGKVCDVLRSRQNMLVARCKVRYDRR
jgi:hypothetical protein